MKSIFDKETREEVVKRINALSKDSKPQWGKMTVTQMVRHCSICEEYYFGNLKVSRSFLGRIIGKLAINEILKDDRSTMRRNSYTSPSFKVTEDLFNLEDEKQKWKSLVERNATYNKNEFTHWFFGKLTKAQLGQLIYKHSDHHLRQFGA